jgi:peptidoglycan/LPS O-acetylase OafA/YrhL
MIILGLIELERSGRISVPERLRNFGVASYSIYLVHTIAQPPILQYVRFIFVHLSPEAATIALAAASVGVGYVFHLIVEVPLTRAVQKVIVKDRRNTGQPSAAPALSPNG